MLAPCPCRQNLQTKRVSRVPWSISKEVVIRSYFKNSRGFLGPAGPSVWFHCIFSPKLPYRQTPLTACRQESDLTPGPLFIVQKVGETAMGAFIARNRSSPG